MWSGDIGEVRGRCWPLLLDENDQQAFPWGGMHLTIVVQHRSACSSDVMLAA